MKQSNNTSDKIIRMQYFNFVLFFWTFCAIWIPFAIIVIDLMLDRRFTWADMLESVWITLLLCGVLALPFVVLSILNRYLFGKVVCMLCEDGIQSDDTLIKWENIEKIEYQIELPARGMFLHKQYNRAIVYTKNKEIPIQHAPLYILRAAKRIRPELDARVNKSSRNSILILIGALFLVPILIVAFK